MLEKENIRVKATRDVPSFAEAVQQNVRVIEVKAAFKAEFLVGKTFLDKEAARLQIQSFRTTKNIPFEFLKSDESYIKLICKHFRNYRSARKGENAEDAGNDKGSESGVQRTNRTTGRTGCSAFAYLRKDTRAIGQSWTIRFSRFEHNHPLSLKAEDQELAISLMRAGTTPSGTLKQIV
ncbi:uncharacterized protein EV154DRAFT_569393 [Mucor mucedo]|uniref:uncharacterized protein n=1 Tax=Mucor mucedo TaxID=29922 RepID=UPI00221FA202|nr:uncharacterized protein EV154DRAFT_569393 [Mucor mucedo]KAI7875842.1 hypothetical protein EV154DRAFT_569393 [Mucor mucedo]